MMLQGQSTRHAIWQTVCSMTVHRAMHYVPSRFNLGCPKETHPEMVSMKGRYGLAQVVKVMHPPKKYDGAYIIML